MTIMLTAQARAELDETIQDLLRHGDGLTLEDFRTKALERAKKSCAPQKLAPRHVSLKPQGIVA